MTTTRTDAGTGIALPTGSFSDRLNSGAYTTSSARGSRSRRSRLTNPAASNVSGAPLRLASPSRCSSELARWNPSIGTATAAPGPYPARSASASVAARVDLPAAGGPVMPTRIRGRSDPSSGPSASRAPASTAGWEFTTPIRSHSPPASVGPPALPHQRRLVRRRPRQLIRADDDRAEVVYRLVVRPREAVAGRPDEGGVRGALGLQVDVERAVHVVLVGREAADGLEVAVPEVVPPAGQPEVEAERLVRRGGAVVGRPVQRVPRIGGLMGARRVPGAVAGAGRLGERGQQRQFLVERGGVGGSRPGQHDCQGKGESKEGTAHRTPPVWGGPGGGDLPRYADDQAYRSFSPSAGAD